MLKEVDEEVEEVLRSLLSWLVANLTDPSRNNETSPDRPS